MHALSATNSQHTLPKCVCMSSAVCVCRVTLSMASPGGQSCSPLEGSASEFVVEGNKSLSNSFSIANILSENVGPQRRPSSDSSPPLDPSPHFHHHQHPPPPPHLSLPLPFPSHTTHPTPPATSNVAVCCSGAGTTPVRALSLSEAASLMLSPPFDSPSAVAGYTNTHAHTHTHTHTHTLNFN